MARLIVLVVAAMGQVLVSCSLAVDGEAGRYKKPEPTRADSVVRVFAVGNVSDAHVEATREVISGLGQQLVHDLGGDLLPESSVYIWADRDAFESEYGEKNGFTRGFINSEEWEVHVYYTGRSPAMGALHEYAHLVLYSLRPTISSEARWLWEAIPIYVSNRPPAPKLTSLKCITGNSVPSLQELSEHGSNIYRVGYHLGEFAVSRWGWEGVGRLIRSGADLQSALGIDALEFRNLWLEHLNTQQLQEEVSADC